MVRGIFLAFVLVSVIVLAICDLRDLNRRFEDQARD